MTKFADWLNSPVGQFVRDIVEGGVSGAAAAVLALQLDVATPRGVAVAAATGFIGAAIAVARRKLVDLAQTKPAT
jgi:hypothetical protein